MPNNESVGKKIVEALKKQAENLDTQEESMNNFDSEPISDDIFMKIANYVMEYAKEHENVSISDLINYVSASDDDQKDEVVSEITSISLDKRYPICTYELLSEYLDIINKERAKKYERFILDKSVEGKSDKEQLKILLEYGKKMEKRLYENKKEN